MNGKVNSSQNGEASPGSGRFSIMRPGTWNSIDKHKRVMGTNPENEVQPKVNECIALNGPSGRPFIESAHNLHELASHQNDGAPQYEGNAIE